MTSPTPPAKVGSLLTDADVGCAIGNAWAGPGGTTLPRLSDCRLPPVFARQLREGDLVYTDLCGQAVINSRCGTVYVFQDTGLRASSCTPGSAPAALGCVEYGAVGMDNTCHDQPVGFITPNSSFSLQGTWVSVMYVPDRQVTVFVVLEGTAKAVALDVTGQQIGNPISVAASQFWFSVSGENQQIGGLDGRVAQPIKDIPAVAHELGIETWLGSVLRIAAPRVDLSSVSMPVINVRAQGGRLDDSRVQEAILSAMDWSSAASDAFPVGDGRIIGLIPNTPDSQPHDLASWGYDPEKARSLLQDANATFDSLFVLADSSRDAQSVSAKLEASLQQIGLPAKRLDVDPADAPAQYADLAERGAVIWISAR